VAQFGAHLRDMLNVVCGSRLFDRSTVNLIKASLARGTSIQSCQAVLREVHTGNYIDRQKAYLRDAEFRETSIEGRLSREVIIEPFGEFSCEYGGRIPTKAKIKEVYLADFRRRKNTMLMWITSLTGQILCSDHTFWAAKNVRENHVKLFEAFFGVMNDCGQVNQKCSCIPDTYHESYNILQLSCLLVGHFLCFREEQINSRTGGKS
jgi:hypothetical protein